MTNITYPKTFKYASEFNPDKIEVNPNLWINHRGFTPLENAFAYEKNLLLNLYSEDGDFLSYQIRESYNDDVETKYKLTKPIFNSFVKTDIRELKGIKIILEGSIDCLLLREYGLNAYTTLGTKKWTIRRLLDDLCEPFIYIPDNDLIGKTARNLVKRHRIVYDVPFGYKDVNCLFLKSNSTFHRFINDLKELSGGEQ